MLYLIFLISVVTVQIIIYGAGVIRIDPDDGLHIYEKFKCIYHVHVICITKQNIQSKLHMILKG